MKDVKWLVIGALVMLVLGFLLGYLIFPKTIIKTEIKEVNVDSTSIIQKARLGYVPENELSQAMKELNKEKSLRFTKISYKTVIHDSVAIRDSVAVHFIPFFSADTNFTFSRETDNWEFNTNIGVETKFYPGVNMMETRARMNTLNISVTYKQPWEFDLFSGGLGFGIGTMFTTGIVYLTK